MDIELAVIGRVLERLLIVGVGAMCVYLGYRLFDKVQERQGELELKGDKTSLKLRDVAPGIYFALFGSILLGVAIYNSLEISKPDGTTIRKYLRYNPEIEAHAIDQKWKDGMISSEQAYQELRSLILQKQGEK